MGIALDFVKTVLGNHLGLGMVISELEERLAKTKSASNYFKIDVQNELLIVLFEASLVFEYNNLKPFITPDFCFLSSGEYQEILEVYNLEPKLSDTYYPILSSGSGEYLFIHVSDHSAPLLYSQNFEPKYFPVASFYDSSEKFIDTNYDCYNSRIYQILNNELICVNPEVYRLLHRHHNPNSKWWRRR